MISRLFLSKSSVARLTLASGLSNPSCTRVLFSHPKLPNSALARLASAPTLLPLSRRILSRRFFCTGGVDDRGGRSIAEPEPDATDEGDGTAEVELRRCRGKVGEGGRGLEKVGAAEEEVDATRSAPEELMI